VFNVNLYASLSLVATLLVLCDDASNVIYKAVVIAKVLHAIPAWWGFTAASDRQKLDALNTVAFASTFTTPTILSWLNLLMN